MTISIIEKTSFYTCDQHCKEMRSISLKVFGVAFYKKRRVELEKFSTTTGELNHIQFTGGRQID